MSKLEAAEITEVTKTIPTAEEFMVVAIPQADLFDQPHPGVRLNRHKFEAGKTYRVRSEVALEVEDRLKKFNVEQVRLLRPNADRKSIGEVNKGSQWTSRGGGSMTTLDHGLGSLGDANEKIYTVDF
jgi:hypothetical protein